MKKDDINLQNQILNTKEEMGKKKKDLTFTTSVINETKKAKVLMKELEEESDIVTEEEISKRKNNKTFSKNLVVSISTPMDVRILEEEYKELLKENENLIKFNRSFIYKSGLENEIKKLKKQQELIKMYEETIKNKA